MSHVREARMLCRKTVDLFTLLSHTQETGSRRIGMTQELLALVTGLAHYLKILIRIALTGALRLEREQSVREAMPSFLDKLHLLAVQGGDPAARRIIKNGSGEAVGQTSGANLGTQGVTYGFRSLAPELAGDSPFSATSPSKLSINNPPSDLCVRCTQTVEEACVRLGTYQRWHSGCLQCNNCGKAAEDKDKEQDKTDKDPSKKPATRRPPANVSIFVYDVESIKETPSFGDVPSLILCTDHAYVNCRGGFQAVSGLEQYAFLLNVALRRLYLLLKRRGVIPLSPCMFIGIYSNQIPLAELPRIASSIAPNPKGGDQDPYRNSGDIMGMKSIHLDRKLSATARLPRRSTIVESPAGRTVHPSEPVNAQRSQQEIKLPQPQRGRTPVTFLSDLEQRSSKQPERLGDIAVDAKRYDEAISHYTTALSLNPPSPQDILIKRSKAFLATGSWKQALDDANQVHHFCIMQVNLVHTSSHQAITLDPSSPWGYEMKHAALHKAGDYDNAVDAFEVMLSKIMESPDPDVQRELYLVTMTKMICLHYSTGLGDQYIGPSSTRATIRKIVQRTIRHLPRVLINTTTGRLHDRAEQASAFEALPIFNELVSSMTTRIDYVRIKREVRQYFRYVMLSHKWEENEPLFQQVVHIAVYDLDQSPTHDKLQTFCKIVRDAGFNWAWSDTCCINKSDHFVLQEALVAMFKWYQGSAMMIVFLRGVRSPSQRGALVKSIWNTRAWTLQEYVASKVIRFYTEDWTLYLDLELPNHKESPEVISEMEQATGVSAQQLMALRPGLSSIREKLRLASTRQTTLVEDAAYSLLGIFSFTGIPAIYGEGEGSLGRLLAHVLAGSGDVSILAWTGESGSFNSCLPAHITVFNGPATSHLPSPIPDAEMERIITASHSSSFDLDVALRLYDRLNELPAPWFAASRMKLPCIAFQLPPFRLIEHVQAVFIARTLLPLGWWKSRRDTISLG
jgi:tetratricopeptide (TPR) repeat protein